MMVIELLWFVKFKVSKASWIIVTSKCLVCLFVSWTRDAKLVLICISIHLADVQSIQTIHQSTIRSTNQNDQANQSKSTKSIQINFNSPCLLPAVLQRGPRKPKPRRQRRAGEAAGVQGHLRRRRRAQLGRKTANLLLRRWELHWESSGSTTNGAWKQWKPIKTYKKWRVFHGLPSFLPWFTMVLPIEMAGSPVKNWYFSWKIHHRWWFAHHMNGGFLSATRAMALPKGICS